MWTCCASVKTIDQIGIPGLNPAFLCMQEIPFRACELGSIKASMGFRHTSRLRSGAYVCWDPRKPLADATLVCQIIYRISILAAKPARQHGIEIVLRLSHCSTIWHVRCDLRCQQAGCAPEALMDLKNMCNGSSTGGGLHVDRIRYVPYLTS